MFKIVTSYSKVIVCHERLFDKKKSHFLPALIRKFYEAKINNLAKEDLLKSLQKTTVSCKQVDFKLIGLSLATINTFLSIVLSVISFRTFFNYEKNR